MVKQAEDQSTQANKTRQRAGKTQKSNKQAEVSSQKLPLSEILSSLILGFLVF